MRKLARALLVVGVVGMAVFFGSHSASAACHSFTIGTVSPSPVQEGGKVTVTVMRDNGVADSHVDIETVNGTAKSGSDFTALDTTVNFTGGTTSKNVSVQTTDDATMESSETFKLHLSNPGGCAPNPNFQIGPDKTVTIAASDQQIVQPTPEPTAAPTAAPTATASPSPSPSVSPSASPSVSPTFTPFPTATPGDDGGLSGLGIAGIIIGAGLVGSLAAVGFFRWRAGR
jgi:hypothetical protein